MIRDRRMAPDLLLGDAVQLSSGGPLMTVYDRLADDWVCCNYLKGTDMILLAVPANSVQRVARLQRRLA
jgi:uncharacterized protein YodC (DUF2158 family)